MGFWPWANRVRQGRSRVGFSGWLPVKASATGAQPVLTVPTIGWVAKDTTSYGFPVSAMGPQQATEL